MLAKVFCHALLRGCLLASVCVLPGVAWSQTPVAVTVPPSHFALEVPQPNGCPQYFPVPTGIGVGLFPATNLRRLPNPDPNTRVPSALRLDLNTSADTVAITVTVLYGDYDNGKAMGSVEKIPHETIATHSGKLNDEVAFPELERVGLEPVTFRIVPPQPITPRHPILRSNAPSVAIDNYATRDRTTDTLTVHNLSARAMVAYSIGSSPDSESGWSIRTMPRIAPGATDQLIVSDSSETAANGTCLDGPKNSLIVLQAALFDDGSYEGNMRVAAVLTAHRLGHDIERQRIRSLAEPILADPDLDVSAMVERIRAAFNQLTVEPDEDTIPRLRAQFPEFPESACAGLALEVSNQMKEDKESISSELQRYQADISPRTTPASFARWWALNNKD
jgi:hypothetical protein